MGVSITKSIAGGDKASELVQLNICVQDSDWLGTFDFIEVERSRGLSTGPFEPLTAAMWAVARVPEDGGDAVTTPPVGAALDIVGDELLLRVNEIYDYVVTFTDPGPGTLTMAQAAAQISTAVPALRTWVDADAKLVLETLEPGTGASLRIVGGDAAPKLGLPTVEPYSLAFGRAARIALLPGQELYTFVDIRGSTEYFYRTRFFGSSTNVASEYTQPSPAMQSLGLAADSLICGQVRLVRMDGRPLGNVQVRVFNRGGLFEKEDRLVSGRELRKLTDADGIASFTLIRGMTVEVVVDGTSLVRKIQVPDDAEDGVFNLLDPSLGPDDYFKARHPDIEYAYKRSL